MGLGSFINKITGAHSAAKQSQKYALQSMAKQFEYEKEAALNAHQWEISDLEKAGLNPILSAGGNGASADAGLTAGSENQGGLDPFSIINTITSAGKTAKEIGLIGAQENQTIADTQLKTQQATNLATENKWIDPKSKAEIAKAGAETGLKLAQTGLTSAEKTRVGIESTRAKGTKEYVLGKGAEQIENAINTPNKPHNYKPKRYAPKYGKHMFGSKR